MCTYIKVDHLLQPQSSKTFPSNDGSELSLPERFSKYFAEKVQSITDELQSSVAGNSREFPEELATSSFSQFRSVTDKRDKAICAKCPEWIRICCHGNNLMTEVCRMKDLHTYTYIHTNIHTCTHVYIYMHACIHRR